MHRLAYLRMIGTRTILARDVAGLIATSSIAEGNRLFDADEDAPDGEGLGDRIARAQYERRVLLRQREWDEAITPNEADAQATAAAFALLRSGQTDS